MLTRRYLVVLLAITTLIGTYTCLRAGQAASPDPGSEADPLVTKSYVENYMDDYYHDLEQQVKSLITRVNELENQVKELKKSGSGDSGSVAKKTIKLTIGNRTAYIGNKAYTLTAAPLVAGSSALLPFRFIGDALAADVKWEPITKNVVFHLGGNTLALKIGSTTANYNGSEIKLDIPPQLVNGVTMVPVRMVSEYLGATVQWDHNTQTITITI